MDKSDLFRHAVNIAELFKSVNEFLTQGEWPDEQQVPRRQSESYDNFHRRHDEFGDPIDPYTLADLGLDDMSLDRVVIELSQDRRNFKVWTPFNEEFVAQLKASIPPKSRRWDPEERCWRVDCYWFGNAQELLPEYFPDFDRFYTERAIRMVEQIAREDEEEERAQKERKTQKKKSAAGRKRKTKSRYTKGKKKASPPPPPPEDDYEYEEEEEEPPPPGDDPYEVLGVSPKAPDEVIKAAHKALARKHHTDITKDPNDKTLNKINAAFERIKEMRKW